MADMPHGTDRPYPIRMLALFEMIRPYHVGIRISGNSRGKLYGLCVSSFVIDTTTFSPAKFPDKYDRSTFSLVIDWSKYLFQNSAGQSVERFPITRLYSS